MYRHTYRARSIPPGASTRNFWLLNKDEQRTAVKRLIASGLSRTAIMQLTGLTLPEIAGLVDHQP
jgi:hypothetical protein